MNRKTTQVLTAAAVAVAVATSSYFVYAAKTVTTTVSVPASVSATVTAQACSNNPGPFITLSGALAIGSLEARLIFRNNVKGTHEHTEPVVVDVTLLEDEVITFSKQPPQGGVGGNPWIFLQLFDSAWSPISERVLLGRCVQGLDTAAVDFTQLTDVDMVVSGSCSNNPGPHITLAGELSFGGVNAIVSFQNSQHNPPHQHDELVEVDIVILEPEETIQFNKQPPLGGVGGNPRVYLQFLGQDGEPLGNEIYLGKCVQLN